MEEKKKEIRTQITLDAEAISEFMMYQIYTGGAGIAVLVLGALNAGLAVAFGIRREWFMTVLFVVFALLLFFGFPIVIKNRVSVLQGQKKFVKPVEYIFDQEGIKTVAADREKKVSWENVKKAVSRKHILILYDEKKHAMVLPVSQLGDDYGAAVDMIADHVPRAAVRIRKSQDRRQTDGI